MKENGKTCLIHELFKSENDPLNPLYILKMYYFKQRPKPI